MCYGKPWPMASETCLVPPREGLGGSGKRRLRDVQERQVESVCLGIEHLVKRRKLEGVAPFATCSDQAKSDHEHVQHCKKDQQRERLHAHEHGHRVPCRLCESTRRVLMVARAHSEQKHHDGSKCNACRMWAKVKARCASLNLLKAVELVNVNAKADNPDDGTGPAKPAVAAAIGKADAGVAARDGDIIAAVGPSRAVVVPILEDGGRVAKPATE